MTESRAIKPKEPADVEVHEETRSGPVFAPPVDIYETDTEILLEADMPGVSADGMELSYDPPHLEIRGRVTRRDRKGQTCRLCEIERGDYQRVFHVGEAIDPSGINAEFTDGVLVVHLPKADGAKVKRIEVKGG